MITVWTYSKVELKFQYMTGKPGSLFGEDDKRLELSNRFREIPGIHFADEEITKRPSVPMQLLRDRRRLEQFIEVLDWYVQEISNPH